MDDGSTDASWQVISQLRKESDKVKAIKFRRNYGKSPALHCAFEKALGEVVITMDADLQDSPDEIPVLYRMVSEEGYDLVSGWKKKRYDDKLTKNLPSKLFHATARRVSGIRLRLQLRAQSLQERLAKDIEIYNDMHRYIPVLAKNAGYRKITEKVVQHQARKYGSSKFGASRFVNGYLDLMTLWFLNRFGRKPMHFFGLWGSLMFLIGFVAVILVGAMKLYDMHQGNPYKLVTDSPYFYISLTMMILGTLLFLAGFLGELVSRNSPERNHYKVEEEI